MKNVCEKFNKLKDFGALLLSNVHTRNAALTISTEDILYLLLMTLALSSKYLV